MKEHWDGVRIYTIGDMLGTAIRGNLGIHDSVENLAAFISTRAARTLKLRKHRAPLHHAGVF